MQGNNSLIWKTTERIMLGIRTRLPDLPASTYNRIFENTVAELERYEAIREIEKDVNK